MLYARYVGVAVQNSYAVGRDVGSRRAARPSQEQEQSRRQKSLTGFHETYFLVITFVFLFILYTTKGKLMSASVLRLTRGHACHGEPGEENGSSLFGEGN